MLLEPSKQTIQRGVHSSSIPEAIWGHTDVLYPGLDAGEVPQKELPREFLACTHEVWDSLWRFLFLHMKYLFQLRSDSVHGSVVLVV